MFMNIKRKITKMKISKYLFLGISLIAITSQENTTFALEKGSKNQNIFTYKEKEYSKLETESIKTTKIEQKSWKNLATKENEELAQVTIDREEIDINTDRQSGQKLSPLNSGQFQLPTADFLEAGQVVFKVTNRLFFLPGTVAAVGTGAYPNVGVTWGVTDNLEVNFDLQLVDSGSPLTQGEFEVNRKPNDNADFSELNLDLKQKIWSDSNNTLAGILSLSLGNRGFRFFKNGITIASGEEQSIVPALQLPFTSKVSEDWRFTISPTVAFFSEENALYLHRPPINDPGSFGTTFGFTGAISYQVSPKVNLWGDAFIPLTGNNSISRESGKPARAIAFNAGLRYLVNQGLAIDIFASNSLGSKGPLALTADREYTAIGTSVVFMPNLFNANRFNNNDIAEEIEFSDRAGFGFFDGDTLPSGKFLFNLQAGSQGILTALNYGVLKDLEGSIYLNYIFGDVDESEQGLNGKIRLFNQQEGSPFTLSLAASLSQTNQPFVNFFNNNTDSFSNSNLDKGLPFLLNTDNELEGRLFIVTVSLPLQYQFDNNASIWFNPIVGYVQRIGTEIAGFNLGGSLPLSQNISLIGEVGANFAGKGNVFIDNNLEDAIPWSVGLRLNAASIFGDSSHKNTNATQLEFFVTNRVGASTWHQLRVREQNRPAIGLGLLIPF
jgi:hypothetical protein